MGFNNKYPYTDFHELNLDWLLDKISGIDARFESIESDIAALQRDNQALGARVSAIGERLDKLFDSIAPEYDETDTYIEGSFVWHNDKLYQANENTTGQWDALDWDEVQISEILFNMERDLDTLRARVSTMAASLDKFDSIAEDYDETLSYQFDQYVFYLNELYRCVTIGGTTPGAFNVSDWVQTSVGHELDQNFQNITSIAYALADPFDALTTYYAGNYVSYNNSVYKALQTVTGVLPSSGAPNWSQVQVMDEVIAAAAGGYESHTINFYFDTVNFGYNKIFFDIDGNNVQELAAISNDIITVIPGIKVYWENPAYYRFVATTIAIFEGVTYYNEQVILDDCYIDNGDPHDRLSGSFVIYLPVLQ